jgi:hypothetical protein
VLETADREAVGTIIVVVGVDVGRIEVQVAGVGTIRTRGPIVGVVALIVDSSGGIIIAVTG